MLKLGLSKLYSAYGTVSIHATVQVVFNQDDSGVRMWARVMRAVTGWGEAAHRPACPLVIKGCGCDGADS